MTKPLLVQKQLKYLSEGNYCTLRDLEAKGYTSREVRHMLLSTHYRKPINFSLQLLDMARNSLQRLDNFIVKVECLSTGKSNPEVGEIIKWVEDEFIRSMDNDLNISGALSAIFKAVKKINTILHSGALSTEDGEAILKTMKKFDAVLGCFEFRAKEDEKCKKLLRLRQEARAQKKWQEADRLRDELLKMGYAVEDTPSGTVVRRK